MMQRCSGFGLQCWKGWVCNDKGRTGNFNLDAYTLRQEFRQDGKTVAAEYTGHKKLLTLRSKMPRELSPEEKRKLAERFSM